MTEGGIAGTRNADVNALSCWMQTVSTLARLELMYCIIDDLLQAMRPRSSRLPASSRATSRRRRSRLAAQQVSLGPQPQAKLRDRRLSNLS